MCTHSCLFNMYNAHSARYADGLVNQAGTINYLYNSKCAGITGDRLFKNPVKI